MEPRTEPSSLRDSRLRRESPELEAETEVDLGRYAAAVAARWWVLLLGLLAGLAAGYALAVGGEEVFRAQALVYLGQPYSAGGAPIQGLSTNATYVRQAIKGEATVRRVARETGIPVGELRPRITAAPVSASGARSLGIPFWTVTVTGDAPRRVAEAANLLAAVVVDRASSYAEAKIASLEEEIDGYDRQLARIDEQLAATDQAARDRSLPALERLVALNSATLLEQRRATVEEKRSAARTSVVQAEEVERGRIVERAAARKVTARSRRNSIVVAGAIGLLLGLAAALAWDPVARRFGSRPAA